MKIKVSIILLIFGLSGIPCIMPTSASTLAMQQFDRSTMIKKKLADAQKFISNEDYIAAQNALNSLLKLDPNNTKAKELLEKCESGIKKQKQKVYQAYQDACKAGTISSLQNFISKYPNSEYVSDTKRRIEDYSLWEKAKEQNTINAYNDYLSQSSILAYKNEAENAITTIKSEIEWNNCKTSNDEDILNSFIQNYSSSKYVDQARYRLNLLKGERYYASNNFNLAYTYLNEANNFQTLVDTPASHLKLIIENREFESIRSSSDVSKVRSYLNTISSSSPFYVPTSNKLAILLASTLSAYSSDYVVNEALAYAKDDETRATVKQYIRKVKDDRAYYERLRKTRARKEWWRRNFQVGIELLDFGLNKLSFSSGLAVYYNMGLSVKLGNYLSPVQVETGIKPGYVAISYKNHVTNYSYYGSGYDYDTDESETFFHMPVYVKLKVNICDSGNGKIYIGGLGTYNAVRNKDYESEYSAGGGIGYATNKWDWFMLYYKQDIGTTKYKDSNYWGTSVIYYF